MPTLERLESKYGIVYQLGYFGYTFLTSIQYCAKDDEVELPADLRGRGIEIVRLEYKDGV